MTLLVITLITLCQHVFRASLPQFSNLSLQLESTFTGFATKWEEEEDEEVEGHLIDSSPMAAAANLTSVRVLALSDFWSPVAIPWGFLWPHHHRL